MTEDEFQNSVINLAHQFGWLVAHFRGVRIKRRDDTVYYQTPVQADGVGFPDLVMVRDGRTIFAELKSEDGRTMPHQWKWLSALADDDRNEVYIWRPSELQDVADILSNAPILDKKSKGMV